MNDTKGAKTEFEESFEDLKNCPVPPFDEMKKVLSEEESAESLVEHLLVHFSLLRTELKNIGSELNGIRSALNRVSKAIERNR